MTSTEFHSRPTAEDQQTLLDVAEASIESGLRTGQPSAVDLEKYCASLQAQGASFVTLRISGKLRGCMGSLIAQRRVIEDVASNAYSAGFQDPRFSALTRLECAEIAISISLLSHAQPIEFVGEADLLSKVRPGIDGLILQEHGQRGTLLPDVWKHVDGPEDFLRNLKLKAGLQPDYWSADILVQRYTTESFHRDRTQILR